MALAAAACDGAVESGDRRHQSVGVARGPFVVLYVAAPCGQKSEATAVGGLAGDRAFGHVVKCLAGHRDPIVAVASTILAKAIPLDGQTCGIL